MSAPIITTRDLGKRYRVGGPRTPHLRQALADGLRAPVSTLRRALGPPREDESLWALRHVDFEVRPGEALGVIGRNGAGKSTLLKLLSRITAPTEGEIRIRGRVASLLEVGTGFHPELTGRENIYLNASILGMRRHEIREKLDSIVDFAGVERFVETPVKRYSSGMKVRLAFAVAAHLEPEILVVDEVLAVGDFEFQKKSLEKMEEVSRDRGRTVLYVSHSLATVRSLCARALLLDRGELVADGPAEEVIRTYLTSGVERFRDGDLDTFRKVPETGDEALIFRRFEAMSDRTTPEGIPGFSTGGDLPIEMDVEVRRPVRKAMVLIRIERQGGEKAALIFTGDKQLTVDLEPGTHTLRCRIRDLPLAPGDYSVDVEVSEHRWVAPFDRLHSVPLFSVVNAPGTGGNWPHRSWGLVHLDAVDWELPPA